jgi:hypothetical protein
MIKIKDKQYKIFHKIDMSHLPHIGQHLDELWVLINKEITYHLYVYKNLSWYLYNMCGEVLVSGDNFSKFLEESHQENLGGLESYGEKETKTNNGIEES